MKTLKYIGTSLLILIIIFIVFAFLQDKEVSVSRSIVINAPVEIVFDNFNDLEKRISWSPWESQDSTMVSTLGPITKGIGASYSWTSEASGNGKLTQTEVVENQLIQTELDFGMGEDNPSLGIVIFKQVEDGVMVTWEVHSNLGNNPMMRIIGRYMDDMVGATFEYGLEAVKSLSEEQAKEAATKYAEVKIKMIVVESKPFIGIMDSCSIDQMSQKIGIDYATLGEFVGKNRIAITEFNRIVYHYWEPPTKVVFEPMFIIDKEISVPAENIYVGNTYGGKVITATHIGPYENSAHVWEAMDAYINNNALELNGNPWEQYENSPRNEPDPNKLITNIFMPIK